MSDDVPEWLSLDPGETVVWRGNPRIRRVASTALMAVGTSLVALVAAVALTSMGNSELSAWVIWAGAVGWTILQAFSLGSSYLGTKHTEYVLTSESLYERTGVLSENLTRVSVAKIQNTELSQDFFANTFDYGTVAVSTAGGSGAEMRVADIDDPDSFRDALGSVMGGTGDAAGSGQTGEARRSAPTARIDSDTVAELTAEARKMREAAERIERSVNDT
jgi:membrane protein YdbS with pleckstrin-like domain